MLTRRAATPHDLAFLLELREATMGPHHRRGNTGQTPGEARARVLDHYECAEILEEGGTPIGLWKVSRDPAEWQLIQVQLLPRYQGTGIGSDLLRSLLAEAKAASVPVALNVLKVNPARRLYERFGFKVVGENEHSYRMRFDG